jgi:hypothetical protein
MSLQYKAMSFEEILALALSERVSHVDGDDGAARAAAERATAVFKRFEDEDDTAPANEAS